MKHPPLSIVHAVRRSLTPMKAKTARKTFRLEHTRDLVHHIFDHGMHAARVESLANGAAGVLEAAMLSIHAIGQAYAKLRGITGKSGIKQIDRFLSNGQVVVDWVLELWVRFVVGSHASIVVAMDWTDFEKDDHTTLCIYLVTTHGRALPLAWKTAKKSQLKDNQTKIEEKLIQRFSSWVPPEVAITVLADRGFAKQELYKLLDSLHWDYVIRMKDNIIVSSEPGESKPAAEWVTPNGRVRVLQNARVTGKRTQVGAVVTVKARRMKESWCLVTSLKNLSGAEVVRLYGRRFSIEETFRDTKDQHFGMGLRATHIRRADRRDRLLLLAAIAHTALTTLGMAAEESGLDRTMKANTVKRRTHSLYRQGLYWYDCIPTMRDEWLARLMTAYDRIVGEHDFLSQVFALQGPPAEASK